MYHYVRPSAGGLPYFPYLSLADFERQLDDFASVYGFVGREDFVRWADGGPAPEGVLLTFDDGLRDHAEFVLPALQARGLFGLFYVSSGPAMTGRILDVHKVHLALGRLGGPAALAWLKSNAPECLRAEEERGSGASPYAHQTSDEATKFLKQLFNWRLGVEEREGVLDGLLDHAFAGAPPRWQDFYVDERGMRELSDAGMGVGPHSHSHEVSIRLSPERQLEEITALLGLRRTEWRQPRNGAIAIPSARARRSRRRPKEPWRKQAARSPSPSRRVTSRRRSARPSVLRCLATTATPSRMARSRMESVPQTEPSVSG